LEQQSEQELAEVAVVTVLAEAWAQASGRRWAPESVPVSARRWVPESARGLVHRWVPASGLSLRRVAKASALASVLVWVLGSAPA
jgi:hypothetical protein